MINKYKILLLISFIIFFGYSQEKQGDLTYDLAELDSLKQSLSIATDSLEVAELCYKIYYIAKFDLQIQNPEEGNYLMRALRIYENHKNWDEVGRIYNSLGGIYYNRKQFEKGRKYWLLAKEQYKKTNNLRRQVVVFNNLSCTYLLDTTTYGQKRMKAYLDSTISLSEKLKDSTLLISPYDNLGAWYMKEKDLKLAEKYTLLSLSISKRINRLSSIQSGTFQLGMIKKEQGYIEQAIQLIEKSISYNTLRKTDPNYMDAVLELSKLYSAIKNYKEAFAYQSIYDSYKDTLFLTKQAKDLLDLEIVYETEKKEQIIINQNHELELMQAANLFKTKLVWTIVIAALLLIGSIYLYRSREFALKAKKLQGLYSRQLLASHEEERKRISRDLHDSVGQSLMLIKNKVALNQDNTTTFMVSKALEEVRTISKALHPAVLDKLGLTASIKKLIADADKYTDIFFSEEIDTIDHIFSKEHELQIYRIAQETINNIIKHSKAQSASIHITNEASKVIVAIKDYGIGFDLIENSNTVNSLGMRTLKERTRLIGGKILIDSTKGKGTNVVLIISRPKIDNKK